MYFIVELLIVWNTIELPKEINRGVDKNFKGIHGFNTGV